MVEDGKSANASEDEVLCYLVTQCLDNDQEDVCSTDPVADDEFYAKLRRHSLANLS